ncbi:MAG: helix-turn-helix transcriptional regulator [Armatimonadota bacterium]
MQTDSPSFEFSANRLRRLCRRIMLTVPAISLSGGPLVLHDVHTSWIPAGRVIPAHTHSFYEGHIVLDGKAILSTPETRQVSTGAILLISPHTPHAWETPDDHVLSFVLWFDLEQGGDPATPLRWAMSSHLLWVVRWLLAEVQEAAQGWDERVCAFLTVLLSRVLTLTRGAQGPSPDAEPDVQLETIIHQFLWDNLQRPLTVAEVAAHVGMSERNLYRKYQALTGETLMQRLQKLRIQRAQTLLEESAAPLPEIGATVGIPDPAYFCRCFKRHTGMSPHKYRIYMKMDS